MELSSPEESIVYSIVVPLFNEEENIGELYRRIVTEMDVVEKPYEVILVDDGSKDSTFDVLKSIQARDEEHVHVIRLRRNFGQTAALAAGIDYAVGDVIITMDGDLQHDPSDLPIFIEKMNEGYDVVSGWRKNRVDNWLMRKVPSKIANWLMAKLSGVPLHDFGTTFKAYRREIISEAELYGELHRFVPALLSWYGISVAEVPIRNINRQKGKSSYGLSRTFRVLFDLMTVKFLVSYITRPLHIFGLIGLVFFGAGFSIALAITLLYYFSDLIINEHLGNLMLAMLLMMLGMQAVGIGLSLEVGVRAYHSAANKKVYAVREVCSRRTLECVESVVS